MIDLKARLKTASLPEKTVPVCLDGKLVAALEQAREAAQQTGDLTGPAHDALRDAERAVQAATDLWLLRGLARPDWTALTAEHLPREDQAADAMVGYNRETFPVALTRACLVDPDVSDDALWAQVDAALTPAQLDELANVAFTLSRAKADLVPFSSPASGGTPDSAEK